MRISIVATAMLIGGGGYAGAGEIVKQDKTPAVKAQKMNDSDMDKVTAGLSVYPPAGLPGSACIGNPLCYGYQSTGGGPSGNAYSNPGRATGAASF